MILRLGIIVIAFSVISHGKLLSSLFSSFGSGCPPTGQLQMPSKWGLSGMLCRPSSSLWGMGGYGGAWSPNYGYGYGNSYTQYPGYAYGGSGGGYTGGYGSSYGGYSGYGTPYQYNYGPSGWYSGSGWSQQQQQPIQQTQYPQRKGKEIIQRPINVPPFNPSAFKFTPSPQVASKPNYQSTQGSGNEIVQQHLISSSY